MRPFGTAHIFEGKLYIQTGKKKDVSKQLHANPKAELCAFKGGEWIRVAGELVEDDCVEAREACGLRHFAFCVDSVEQTVRELAEVGIECESIRVDDYTGKKMTFFHDPDGLPLELHE